MSGVFRPADRWTGDAAATSAVGDLRNCRGLALVAVERTRMPMMITDPHQEDNPVVLANQAFLELTGYSENEVLGRNCRFLQGSGTSGATIDAIRAGLAAGGEISVELLNYRKDGSAFLNELMISPVHDADGALVCYFASQKDVTEQRRAQALEETERLLLKEVDHRAMNALAIVQSIVRLSRRDSTQDYASAILGRVDALARAHRLLSDCNWSSADFRDVVALEAPVRSDGRLKIDGPSILLPAQKIQPISLVIHELMSNAVRHGALAHANGSIELRWRTSDGRTLVRWQERGVQSVLGTPQPGLGLKMIKGVIANQLRGSFNLDWGSQGIDVKLAF
jgi:PAS domain S-box-containing protein